MTRPDLLSLIDQLAGRRVLVVGDVCLDEYLIGRARRLSREAPVPILDFDRRLVLPGAAANPARNIVALGSAPSVIGVVGDDAAGAELTAVLRDGGADVRGLIIDPSRPTSVKTRVLGDSDYVYLQHIVRLDRGSRAPLDRPTRDALLCAVETQALGQDAILVSDYRSGVVDDTLIAHAQAVARRHGIPIAVDSQGDLLRFADYSLVRCNRHEAEATLRRPLTTDDDFAVATRMILDQLRAEAVVITRGPDGLAARSSSRFAVIPATNRSEVFDAVGAGDTVIAVLALGLAAGADAVLAAELANIAAGIVVRRFGNAVTTPDEVRAAVRRME
ncbi:MAG: bifunctional ADP-heptose synthase [Dehalococcoidia bacterium]|nr:bifunctional ADP-heptose synthase [Dehalococcoidia bacterium]